MVANGRGGVFLGCHFFGLGRMDLALRMGGEEVGGFSIEDVNAGRNHGASTQGPDRPYRFSTIQCSYADSIFYKSNQCQYEYRKTSHISWTGGNESRIIAITKTFHPET